MRKIICIFLIFIAIINICQNKISSLQKPTQPLASIVITSYNRTQLLQRAINSAINQTYKNIEIIIVDDGSNQKTLDILKNLEKSDTRINVVLLPKNSGTAAFPRAVGNSVAKGKYITTLDSDDILMPEMVEKAVNYMEKNKHITLLRVETRHYNSGEDPFTQNWLHIFPLYNLLFHSIGQGGFVFRREFIEKHNIFPNPTMHCSEDWDFTSKMLIQKANFAHLYGSPLYIIRYHNENAYNDCSANNDTIFTNILTTLTLDKQQISNCEIFKKAIEFNPNIFDEKTKIAGLKNLCQENK